MNEQEAQAIATEIAANVRKRIQERDEMPQLVKPAMASAIFVDLRDEIKQLILVPPQ